MSDKNLLEVSQITKATEFGKVLSKVSFDLKFHENLVIAGATGSGKSTLLKIIAGLEQPDSGTVTLEGKPVAGPADTLVPGHPKIAYLSQHFELPKFLRVEQVLRYASNVTDAYHRQILSICKITHLAARKTDQLSGGEKQRIAIARLLVTHPQVLLLDEPYSHLDTGLKATLKEVVSKISSKLGVTCVLVSHHPEDTLPWAHRVLVMKNGVIVQQGLPQQVYQQPKNEYVARLFGAYNLVDKPLARLLGKSNVSNKILRPEHFEIIKRKSGRWVVSETEYFGSYYLVTVEYQERRIKVFTLRQWAVGEFAELRLNQSI
ncbi:MAG: ABC transporter [Bacteroidetes bacterium OLB12]|nr:MAG: ABC transporter [Bacteroidetes bacterium OLB12]HNU41816.1 ABC transporter ATP-binding protein [Cyclobacteriaceae bacterium]